MAARTSALVAGLTLGWPFSTLDTVCWETPARLATSAITTGRGVGGSVVAGTQPPQRGLTTTLRPDLRWAYAKASAASVRSALREISGSKRTAPRTARS